MAGKPNHILLVVVTPLIRLCFAITFEGIRILVANSSQHIVEFYLE